MTEEFTPQDIDAALRLRVGVGGRERAIQMRLRSVADVVPDARAPEQQSAGDVPYLVLDLIETVDGETPGLEDAEEISREPEALTAVLTARNRLWSELRMRGRLLALCPHCGQRESSFELSTLALVLRALPPPLFAAGGVLLAVPTLADPRPAGRRTSHAPMTPRLRTLLPSGRLGLDPASLEAVLRDLDSDAEQGLELEAQAWQRWAPAGVTPPAERSHWRRQAPGFRAILRMSVALRSLDGSENVTPEAVESLSIADFFFLDACYYLTHNVDQPRADALLLTCEACGGDYLPLR